MASKLPGTLLISSISVLLLGVSLMACTSAAQLGPMSTATHPGGSEVPSTTTGAIAAEETVRAALAESVDLVPTKQALARRYSTRTPTSTSRPTETHTPTSTATHTPTSSPTLTPTPTSTPTATPSSTATRTPTSTPTATRTPVPVPTETHTVAATATWRPSSTPLLTDTIVPKPTPTSILELTPFRLAIEAFLAIEKRTLETLDPLDAVQLPTHAHGEALDSVVMMIEVLRDAGLYQVLTIESLEARQPYRLDNQMVGVIVQERHTVRTYRSGTEGSQLVDQQSFDGTIVYGLIYHDGRWKVDRVRPLKSTEQ